MADCNGWFGGKHELFSSCAELTDNGDVASWWRELSEVFRSIPAGMREGSRFGRIFGLRDKGRLEEALREALSLANDLLASTTDMDRTSVIIIASTIDDIAQRLDRPEVAYDVLTRAVTAIEQLRANMVPRIPRTPGDFASQLESYDRLFRDRLNMIVSRRNS